MIGALATCRRTVCPGLLRLDLLGLLLLSLTKGDKLMTDIVGCFTIHGLTRRGIPNHV